VPHHVTQRGNRRQTVFFSSGDHLAYLAYLRDHAAQHGVGIVAYCLMPNHVHLIAVPDDETSLHRTLQIVHGRYAQRVNRMRNQSGHLWQARYFASPLDADYFVRAVRYVELNPVRAGLSSRAEDFSWSSAAAHCGQRKDTLIRPAAAFEPLRGIADWARWLGEGVDDGTLTTFRRHGAQNLPCGSEDFVSGLEAQAGRMLRYRPPGREAELKRGQTHLKVSVPFKGVCPL
jgi:putative transposase